MARTRRLDLAEDALGEAFAKASERWAADGVPANPSAWLFTTATRQIVGVLRAEAMRGRKAPLIALGSGWTPPPDASGVDGLGDERLSLILLCCHPSLHPEARSPLALRLVVGTSTDEIAQLFLVQRATMAARITRAKKKIVLAGIPLSSPVDEELRSRLVDVCRTIYLAFTAGYAPRQGRELLRSDLAGEAVELAAVLHRLVPDSPEAQAMYGLLLLQHARRHARVSEGNLVTLADQDRSLWRSEEQRVGARLISNLSPCRGYTEELRLQGLIALEHARAPRASDTDWATIAGTYRQLYALTGSPVVRLNLAVAVAEAQDPLAGLAELGGLETTLADNHRFFAVRAALARRAGHESLARSSYQEALDLCGNEVEREYLRAQLSELDASA